MSSVSTAPHAAPADVRDRPAGGNELAERLGESARSYLGHVRYLARWSVRIAPVAAAVGSAVAFFLWALDVATRTRWAHPWLLWWLPVGGVVVGGLYHWRGKSAEGGNNLIMDEIHEPGGGVPGRMAPLVLFGTLVTHLFGGSAGREGTAVQMGGSLASTFDRLLFSRLPGWFQLDEEERRILLQTGVAAGFGAVFGTPITGAIFALEVLAIGRLSYAALVPCLLAALLGDWVTGAWGIRHTEYPALSLSRLGVGHLDLVLLGKVAVAAAAFGLASSLFAETTHALARGFKRLVSRAWLRPALGAGIVILLSTALGTTDFLGLGVTSPERGAATILSAFQDGNALPWTWLLKLLFTAVTLSAGFKGGEVTPLFFVGAWLGHTLGVWLDAPVPLFAAMGFVAVFAGATNTPLACAVMGIELFGADAAIYLATASFVAYLFSGHSGIYLAQRLATPKGDLDVPIALTERRGAGVPLRVLHESSARPTHSASSGAAVSHLPPSPSTSPVLSASVHDISEARHGGNGGGHLHAHGHAHGHTAHHPHGHVDGHLEPQWPRVPVSLARVYVSPRDRNPSATWFQRLVGTPLATEIVVAAQRYGLPHALVLTAHYGYTAGGPIAYVHPEHGTASLTQCVELMGTPEHVHAFCREHMELLAGHPVIMRHAEQWELSPRLAAQLDERGAQQAEA